MELGYMWLCSHFSLDFYMLYQRKGKDGGVTVGP